MVNTKGTEMKTVACKCLGCKYAEQDTYGNTYKTLICKHRKVWKRYNGFAQEFRSAGAVNRLKKTPSWCPKIADSL
jgi:hypothetical protein